jgi:hypothetical protein
MTRTQKQILIVLLLLGFAYFLVLFWPNSQGARDPDMITIFEPDESIQYGHPIRMLSGGHTFKDTLRKFIFYQHYYYGFPFYLVSVALALLPIKLVTGLENTALNMMWMRQMVSVLPMVLAVLVLVYLQTRFKRWVASIALFIFLLTIPAVFENSTWWHPDSLTMLFIALTFFFLDRDDLRFGVNFYFAAVACGLAVATKLLGLFFFLAIPIYILIGLNQRRLRTATALRAGVMFVSLMAVSFVLANPFLLEPANRQFAIDIQTKQAAAMSAGWNVYYSQGPLAWYPMISEFYGSLGFICLALLVSVLCIVKNHKRLLNILILAWTIPFFTYVMAVIVIKPHHFLIPVFLPLFSSLAAVFIVLPPPEINWKNPRITRSQIPALLITLLVAFLLASQFYYNLTWSIDHYAHSVNKEKENAQIEFYEQLEQEYLTRLPEGQKLTVFRDARAYFPRSKNRYVITRTRPVTYEVIQKERIDLIIMWNQRIRDYTAPGILENAIDPEFMQQVIKFYKDLDTQSADGFQLISQAECCSAWIKTGLQQQYFP